MGTAIWLVVKPYALKALAVIAAIITVLAILARVKNAGRLEERVEMAATAAKVERDMAKAAARGPKTKSEVRKRLREGTF